MKLTHLMIHCTDTPQGMNVTPEMIHQWHIIENGWSKVGYSVLVGLEETHNLIPFNDDDKVDRWEISNGAKGWNGNTRHLCYAGGADNIDTRNYYQRMQLASIAINHVKMHRDIKLIGHNQVNAKKYCPSFDVPCWALSIGIPTKNIDFNCYF